MVMLFVAVKLILNTPYIATDIIENFGQKSFQNSAKRIEEKLEKHKGIFDALNVG